MMDAVFLHVDLDAFYASVEQLDNPSLKGKPVIVGASPGRRGVVSACSYEARRFGVRSAMPISQAYRRCPDGIYLPVRMERYLEVSEKVMGILRGYTPHLQQISIDEAFLDLSGTERLFGPVYGVARKIKDRVKAEVGLAISIGIAANKYLAKIATNYGKPDGLVIVKPGEEEQFLGKLELKNLWGLGEKTLERLRELNITTVQMLRSFGEAGLSALLGNGAGRFLYCVSRGMDPGIYSEQPKSRSMSSETTFEVDRKDLTGIRRVLLELSHQVMYRMIQEGWKSRTPCLKLRFHDFTTTSVQKTLKHWVSSSEELYGVICEMLDARWNRSTPIRLVGVGLSNLVAIGSSDQLELFADPSSRKRKVEEAVFRIKAKMGDVKLTKASLLKKEE